MLYGGASESMHIAIDDLTAEYLQISQSMGYVILARSDEVSG